MSVDIRRYTTADEESLLDLLLSEGEEWADYSSEEGFEKYKLALKTSIVYVLYENSKLCGFARLRDDDGFGMYVYDLLVHKDYRGKEYGRMLLEQAHIEYPSETVYVMSDVDAYYENLGYSKEGSVFLVNKPSD